MAMSTSTHEKSSHESSNEGFDHARNYYITGGFKDQMLMDGHNNNLDSLDSYDDFNNSYQKSSEEEFRNNRTPPIFEYEDELAYWTPDPNYSTSNQQITKSSGNKNFEFKRGQSLLDFLDEEDELDDISGKEKALKYLRRKLPNAPMKRMSSMKHQHHIHDSIDKYSHSKVSGKKKSKGSKKPKNAIVRTLSLNKKIDNTDSGEDLRNCYKNLDGKSRKQVRFADLEGEGPLVYVHKETSSEGKKKMTAEKVRETKNSWAWTIF